MFETITQTVHAYVSLAQTWAQSSEWVRKAYKRSHFAAEALYLASATLGHHEFYAASCGTLLVLLLASLLLGGEAE